MTGTSPGFAVVDLGFDVPAIAVHDKKEYVTHNIPLEQIHCNDEFNIRGHIIPMDVLDLARDIQKNGLDTPIVIRPITNITDKKYEIVAGHRRYTAHRVNQAPTIPSFIRTDLNEQQARSLNLRENLHRKSLNILQEAKAIEYFVKANFTDNEIAQEVGMSPPWVNVRKLLLKLDPEIQKVAAAGFLTQDQIKSVSKIKDKAKQFELVKSIKERRENGEKVAKTGDSIQRTKDALKLRKRQSFEVTELKELIYDLLGPCLATKALAWATADLTTAEVYAEIEKLCKEEGVKFTMPDYVSRALCGVND